MPGRRSVLPERLRKSSDNRRNHVACPVTGARGIAVGVKSSNEGVTNQLVFIDMIVAGAGSAQLRCSLMSKARADAVDWIYCVCPTNECGCTFVANIIGTV